MSLRAKTRGGSGFQIAMGFLLGLCVHHPIFLLRGQFVMSVIYLQSGYRNIVLLVTAYSFYFKPSLAR